MQSSLLVHINGARLPFFKSPPAKSYNCSCLIVAQKEIHAYQDKAKKYKGFSLMCKLFKGAEKKKLTLIDCKRC
jgi:hypothetical protein